MERLDIRIIPCVHVRYCGVLDEFLVVITANGAGIHQEVRVLDSWDDNAEDTDTYTHTFRMNVVDDTCRLEEHVRINLQLRAVLKNMCG